MKHLVTTSCVILTNPLRIPMISQDLGPGNEAQRHEDLRLHLNWYVEVLGNGVYAERNAAWAVVSEANLQPGPSTFGGCLHNAQRNIIKPGRPSVVFVRQLVHIWGIS